MILKGGILDSKNSGFTLIELIVVIVILGILAVTAVPKFVSLESDARKATMKGLAGAFKSGVLMVKSKAVIQGVPETDSATYVDIGTNGESKKVYTVNGYPYLPLNSMSGKIYTSLEDFDKVAKMGVSHFFQLPNGDWNIRASNKYHGIVVWPNNGPGKTNDGYNFQGEGVSCFFRYGLQTTEDKKAIVSYEPVYELSMDGC